MALPSSQAPLRSETVSAGSPGVALPAALMLGFVALAINDVIVVPALPSVAERLGAAPLYGLAAATYVLGLTIVAPTAGRLADLFGPVRVYVFGMLLFLVGCLACAAAPSMTLFTLCRALQGAGRGVAYALSWTLIAQAYDLRGSARMQALGNGMWGLTAVLGLGLVVIEPSWRLVFFLPVPFGLAAILLSWRERRAGAVASAQRLRTSAILMFSSIIGLAVAALVLRQAPLAARAGLVGLACLLAVLLVRLERRAETRIVDPALLGVRAFRPIALGSLAVGVCYWIALFIPPLLSRQVPAVSPVVVVTAFFVSWSLGHFFARVTLRVGFRGMGAIGGSLVALGYAVLLQVDSESGALRFVAAQMTIGFGLAVSYSTSFLASRASVASASRGSANALVPLLRQLGGSAALATVGTLLAAGVPGALSHAMVTGGIAALVFVAISLWLPRLDAPSADAARQPESL